MMAIVSPIYQNLNTIFTADDAGGHCDDDDAGADGAENGVEYYNVDKLTTLEERNIVEPSYVCLNNSFDQTIFAIL